MQSIQSTAKRIKELCDMKGISINKMLIESGAGARTYHNMLAGSYPSMDKAAKIADYLDCSIDYLLGRTDVPEVNRGDNYSQIPHYAQSAASTGRELGKSQSPDDVVEITALQEYEKNK